MTKRTTEEAKQANIDRANEHYKNNKELVLKMSAEKYKKQTSGKTLKNLITKIEDIDLGYLSEDDIREVITRLTNVVKEKFLRETIL
jgi:hypothetical protein